MLIAHLTDLHLCPPGELALRVSDTVGMTRRAFEAVAALPVKPDALVITGDLTENGRPEEYALLRSMLAGLGLPTLLLPGNHDDRENLVAGLELGPHAVTDGGFVQFLADLGPIRLIGLDTVQPGSSAGAICDIRLDFLEAALAGADGRPVALFMHHPPFSCGLGYLDAVMLKEGAGRLAEIVAHYPNIERVLCGHHHRPVQVRYAGTLGQVAPGVSHQVILDLREGAPARFLMEPPAFLLHLFAQDRLISHTAYSGRYDGPYPFRPDAS
ncbi:phosphodiesterase [Bosea caraganae]|uniref:Phosphodiesterase n=1 Tax=Bosea caraganae TaxID=2763117 RepID=A0A370L2G2_9HYPH|nr:phosphodiesterase [Bosea caraganae]RDJ22447.1 phosphodiesterase [Bosea caraganae]RDJ30406.1 phosphodiesterase [Bosea caraganae]